MKRAIRLGRCEISLICRHDLRLLGRKPQSLPHQLGLIFSVAPGRAHRKSVRRIAENIDKLR